MQLFSGQTSGEPHSRTGGLIRIFRYLWFAWQEFNRTRGFEKASALGYQTIFSLIPALVLVFSILQTFGAFESLPRDVTQFIMHQLNLDRIEIPVPEEMPLGTTTLPPSGEPQNGQREQPKPLDASERTEPTGNGSESAPLDGTGPTATGQPADQRPVPTARLSDVVNELVSNLIRKMQTRAVNLISLLWLVVAAMSLAVTLETALNDVWGSTSQRSWVNRIVVYWAVLTLGPLLIGLPISLAQHMDVPLRGIAVSIVSSSVAFFVMYYWMPVAPVRPTCALFGAFCATGAWEIAKWLFGLYLQHAVGYGRLYGNLALLPITLFWLWISWAIVLMGAAITYTIQNRHRLESTARGKLTQAHLNPGWVALAVVLRLARAFRKGEGPVASDELAAASGLPDRQWNQLLALLRERGIIITVGSHDERIVLGRSPDDLPLAALFDMIEGPLPRYFEDQWPSEAPQLLWVFRKWTKARDESLGSVTVAALLRQPQAEETSPVSDSQTSGSLLDRILGRFRFTSRTR